MTVLILNLQHKECHLWGQSDDIPRAVSVEWSWSGINWPSLSPESQSQSTPDWDWTGWLFTQPQTSISKSQKPAQHRCVNSSRLAPTDTTSIHFHTVRTCWETGTVQNSKVVDGNISPRSSPNNCLKNHLSVKTTNGIEQLKKIIKLDQWAQY